MFRTLLFWLHLVSGVVAGLIVLIMSATGVALTFQPQMLEARRSALGELPAPAGAERMPLSELVQKHQSEEKKVSGISLRPGEHSALTLRFGRQGIFVNPWTGEEIADPATGWQKAFGWLVGVHRWLGLEGEGREVGRALTGACNLAFVFMGLSGLYLWMPRRWSWKSVRAVLWFRRGLSSKARDFNWHNVIGFWTLPVVLLLALSGVVISYDWAKSAVYRVAGEEPPAPGSERAPPKVQRPEAKLGQPSLSYEALLEKAREAMPEAREITLQLPKKDAPVFFTLQKPDTSPPYAALTLVLDPATGETLLRQGYEDQTPGRKLRGFLRYAHTGEAFGWFGQLVAGIASLGGVLLVWTGVALSWRRFVRFRKKSNA